MISTTEQFSTILENRDDIDQSIHLMNTQPSSSVHTQDHYVVDLNDFSFKKVRIGKSEMKNYENNLDYMVYPDDEPSLLELCKMKIYYWGLKLDMPPDRIKRVSRYLGSWLEYMSPDTYIPWLRLNESILFP